MGLQLCFQCARAFSHICNFSKCLKIPESMMSKRQYHGDFYRIVQFSCSVVSESLRSRGPQHTRLPCPSPTPELALTHVHWVVDAIQPSHPLLLPYIPAFNPSQHQGLFWVSALHQVGKVLDPGRSLPGNWEPLEPQELLGQHAGLLELLQGAGQAWAGVAGTVGEGGCGPVGRAGHQPRRLWAFPGVPRAYCFTHT